MATRQPKQKSTTGSPAMFIVAIETTAVRGSSLVAVNMAREGSAIYAIIWPRR